MEGAPPVSMVGGGSQQYHRNREDKGEESRQKWDSSLVQLQVWHITSGKPNKWLMGLNLSDSSKLGRIKPMAAELKDWHRIQSRREDW